VLTGSVGHSGRTRASICSKGMRAHHSLCHVARGLPSLVTWHCRRLVEPRGMTMLTGGGVGRRLLGRRIMLSRRLLVQLSLVDPCFLLWGSHFLLHRITCCHPFCLLIPHQIYWFHNLIVVLIYKMIEK